MNKVTHFENALNRSRFMFISKENENNYMVINLSNNNRYNVTVAHGIILSCSCPHFVNRKVACKHILATSSDYFLKIDSKLLFDE